MSEPAAGDSGQLQDASHLTPPFLEVAAGLIFANGRLLIAQRRAGDHLGGLWEFPGGKLEPGETAEACLRRELEEELGVRVRVGERVETISHDYPERRVRLHFFRCELVEGEPRAIGCAAVRWIRREELHDFEFPAADAQLLLRLEREVLLWR